MYCRYCGKPIVEDSVFCQHCGQNLRTADQNIIVKTKFVSLLGKSSYSKIKRLFTFEKISSSIKLTVKYIWKVVKTIFVIITMIVAYTFLYALWSPVIALFNAEPPSLGFSDRLSEIWKKDNTSELKLTEEDS